MDHLGRQLEPEAYPGALKLVRTLYKQKWIILGAALLVAASAVVFSQRQQTLYRSSSQVLLKYQNLASGLTGIQNQSGFSQQDPVRFADTQAQVAMSPAVGERVVAAARVPGLTPQGFLGSASVAAAATADVLLFAVTYPDAAAAERLATVHARQYIAYRQQLDNASLVAARNEIAGRIAELRASRLRNSALLNRLVDQEQQLRTMEALQTANASLLRPAEAATKVQPKPVRNAVLGVILGLMLGVGLAFGRTALDTRVLAAAEIGDRLGLPLLGRIPAPPRKLASRRQLVMVMDPHSAHAEAFRMLRTNVDFVNIDRGARSIVFSSALEKEGKSTTVANLAVAFARSGARVALVDLDLRRPAIGDFFDIERSQPGVTSVVRGRSTLSQALVEVFRDSPRAATATTEPRRPREGLLKVLVAGELPPDPGEFISTNALARTLEELREAFDLVLIDTPPLLAFGDAAALTTRVDGMVLITRLKVLKRPVVGELFRALQTCGTVKLGYVATGAELEESYGADDYGYQAYSRSAAHARQDRVQT